MFVGICRFRLRLPENETLKGKRQVVKSLVERLRNRFDLSVAEVESNDLLRLADIGFACVSNSASLVDQIIDRAIAYVEESRPDVEIVDLNRDVIPFE